MFTLTYVCLDIYNGRMKTNPGGQLAPEEILGRDKLIDDLWDILDGRNVYMNDLRRIGKTMILRKMEAEPPKGWIVSKRDLGGVKSAAEFANQVYRDALQKMGTKKRMFRWMNDLINDVGGTQVGGILTLPGGNAVSWKDVLTRTFADLHQEQLDGDEHIIFLWDEVPFMIDNIREIEGAKTAMEVLDVLRSLSQDYDSIRLLLTGSIGMHHVLKKLCDDGYNGSPLNTFEPVSPGPLEKKDAVDLAKRLFKGEGRNVKELRKSSECVAELTGNVPFYIHRLISRTPRGETITPCSLIKLLDSELCATDDDWDLEHYRKRIRAYYPQGSDEKIVLAILDGIAKRKSMEFSAIMNEVNASIDGGVDDEHLRELLKLLMKDHYLERDAEGIYTFRLVIVRRWWVLDRNLEQMEGEGCR